MIAEGPFAHSETVAIEVVPLGNGIFAVSWVEESGAMVTNVQDYDRGVVRSFVTLAGGEFLRMTGSIEVTKSADRTSDARPERNKELVIEAMTALFQRRDASAVERLYAPKSDITFAKAWSGRAGASGFGTERLSLQRPIVLASSNSHWHEFPS